MNIVRKEDIEQIITGIPYEKCDGKTFLIAGANGFLASYMVDTLMYLKRERYIQNCTVIALCRNKEKAERVFREWLDDVNFLILIQPVEKAVDYAGRIDYIIHAASCSTTQLFESCPADVMSANLIGCYNLLELAKEKNVSGFLFFSSGAVYGPTDEEEIREDKTYTLDFLETKNSYAIGKRAGEALCRAYWKQYHVPARGVRISHTYGPGIDLEDGHVYSDFVKNIITKTDIEIKGDGIACRPFCYVSDATRAFFLVLLCGEDGEMYNMANNDMNVTVKELADLLTEKVFPERRLQVVVKNLSHGKKPYKVKVNVDKLGRLGWRADIDLEKGFRRLVKSIENDLK